MAIDGLIFDFDGTLAELNIDFAAMRAAVEALARSLGYTEPWPRDGYLLEQVAAVSPHLEAQFPHKAQAIIIAHEVAAASEGRLFPFSLDLLRTLRDLEVEVAIISRNCGAAIRRVFPQVESLCRVFLPREAVLRPKPDPAHVRAALKAMGLAPGQTAVVGDHPLDVSAALAAGCLAVGVASGRIKAPELAAAGAQVVLPDASGLVAALGLQRAVKKAAGLNSPV